MLRGDVFLCILSHWTLTTLCKGSSCCHRSYTSSSRSVSCYAPNFWVISFISSPCPTPKHVSCQKSAEYQLRLDPAEAMARQGHFLSAWHPRLQERDWQLFLPGRIMHSKVRKEQTCPVSDRISKRYDLTHHPKKQVYLALGRRET